MTAPATQNADRSCVWVTGASSGIGRAVALKFSAAGWAVAASARGGEALEKLAAEDPNRNIRPAPVDITDPDAVARVVEQIESDIGEISLAVLNAGIYLPVRGQDFTADAFRRSFDLNLMGTVHCLDAWLSKVIARRRGHVAIVSSVAGYRGLGSAAAYGASKAALINMAEALKIDLADHGIKVQVVTPGFVKTPATDSNPFPMPFLVSPEEAGERIYSGLMSERFEITFPRRFTFLLKIGRCLPYSLYFRLAQRTRAGG